MNLKNSIYKLSFAAMIMMAMNATDLQAQGVVPAQKGEKTFTLEDLNFGGNNYRNMVAKNRLHFSECCIHSRNSTRPYIACLHHLSEYSIHGQT